MTTIQVKEDYHIITTQEALQAAVEELKQVEVIGLDLETSGLEGPDVNYIVGWGLSCREGQAYYIPVAHDLGDQLDPRAVIEALKPVLEDPSKKILVHNAKFDHPFLVAAGIYVDVNNVEDTMLEVYVAAMGHTEVGLKYLVLHDFKHEMVEFTKLFPRGTKESNMNIASLPIDLVGPYCCEDTDYCRRLHFKYYDRVSANLIYNLERQLWPVTGLIEKTGFKTDKEYLVNASRWLAKEAEKIQKIIYAQMTAAVGQRCEPKLSSPKQLREVLYDMMQLPVYVRTGKKREPSTDEKALNALAIDYPVARNILTYRGLIAAISTMVGNVGGKAKPILTFIREDGRVHASYFQTGAITGRYSCGKPNMQNRSKYKKWTVVNLDGSEYNLILLPREAFVADDDYYLIELDFKAIEMVIMFQEAGEEEAVAAYLAGLDIHQQTASVSLHKSYEEISGTERDVAKMQNYLVIYGGSAYGLAQRTRRDEDTTEQELRAFWRSHPKTLLLCNRIKEKARKAFCVYTHFGRRRPIADYKVKGQKSQSSADRQAVNGVIQGTAADIQKMGLVRTPKASQKRWTWKMAHIVAHTHDSQTWEVHRSISPQEIIPVLVDAMSPEIPGYPRITVDSKLGVSWGVMEEYDQAVDYSQTIPRWDEERAERLEELGSVAGPATNGHQMAFEESTNGDKPFYLVFNPGEKPTGDGLTEVMSVMKAKPGENVVIVSWAGQEIPLPKYSTSLNLKEALACFKPIYPKCTVTIDTDSFLESALEPEIPPWEEEPEGVGAGTL